MQSSLRLTFSWILLLNPNSIRKKFSSAWGLSDLIENILWNYLKIVEKSSKKSEENFIKLNFNAFIKWNINFYFEKENWNKSQESVRNWQFFSLCNIRCQLISEHEIWKKNSIACLFVHCTQPKNNNKGIQSFWIFRYEL